ncbi:hypothetical protein Pst134EA_003191 [Puccinia striiformis f. sp. tritici]|uniref:uncharacterized protein n=1 Tax=Puccinia striiformis f. sp. tritici TaxID=168172 RepID=UPI0020089B1E|nr:uncharacterized protein Pst134EA_031459 [Puccinia striiformis f. sp. tritici]XP_047812038.1 hypothetical protein Pst134EA_003191 [Puccinia striiformis f. sp. tritici]KAH9445283.1 hypothetical protein Pst134EA_031459 [Puccinia striiformis f. sp. tritici]KAH9472584.1 hypothetical protein Pst134EA_003191 [Puccinia striiformis f. sp. tritici]
MIGERMMDENTFILSIERLETYHSNGTRYTKFSITGHFNQAIDYQLLITPKAFFKPRKIEIQDQIFTENFYDSENNGNRMVTTRNKQKEWTFKIDENRSYTCNQKITARSGSIVCDSSGQIVAKLSTSARNNLFSSPNYQVEVSQSHPIMNILTVIGLILTLKEEVQIQSAAGGVNCFGLGLGINPFAPGPM